VAASEKRPARCSFNRCTATPYAKFQGTLYCRVHYFAASKGRRLVPLRAAATRVERSTPSAPLIRFPGSPRQDALEDQARELRKSPNSGVESGRFAVVVRSCPGQVWEVRVRNAGVEYRGKGQSFTGVFVEIARYLARHSVDENIEVLVRFPAQLSALRSRFRTLHTWQARVEHARERLVSEAYRLGLDRSDLRYLLELPEDPGPLPDPAERGGW
jgi:hypothetical protein